jgi:hypothetical protein
MGQDRLPSPSPSPTHCAETSENCVSLGGAVGLLQSRRCSPMHCSVPSPFRAQVSRAPVATWRKGGVAFHSPWPPLGPKKLPQQTREPERETAHAWESGATLT